MTPTTPTFDLHKMIETGDKISVRKEVGIMRMEQHKWKTVLNEQQEGNGGLKNRKVLTRVPSAKDLDKKKDKVFRQVHINAFDRHVETPNDPYKRMLVRH